MLAVLAVVTVKAVLLAGVLLIGLKFIGLERGMLVLGALAALGGVALLYRLIAKRRGGA